MNARSPTATRRGWCSSPTEKWLRASRRRSRRPDDEAFSEQRMKNYDLIELAGRNLRESVLRNGLTTAGIAVGVASLVAMLSLGIGLQALADRNLNRSGIF